MPDTPEVPTIELAKILGGVQSDKFLAHVYSPKKNPRPVGLRKRTVAKTSARNARRVKSYNAYDAVKQRVIDAVGRERYLSGEITLVDARRELRPTAISQGAAKPVRPRKSVKELRDVAEENILEIASSRPPTRSNGRDKPPIRRSTVHRNIRVMKPRQLSRAIRINTFDELMDAATDEGEYFVDTDTGEEFNPFWYH